MPKYLCRDKLIKLKSISFISRFGHHPYRIKRNEIAKSTKGIRLHFTNQFSTERYHKEDNFVETTVQIDPKRTIAKIEIGISVCDSIIAIRLYDNTGELFVNENWWDIRGYNPYIEICHDGNYEADLKEWFTHSIPDGHEIIGLKWYKNG